MTRAKPRASKRARRPIVVDTNVLIALAVVDDDYHEPAKEWLSKSVRRKLVVPTSSIIETCQLLARINPLAESLFLRNFASDTIFTMYAPGRVALRRMADLVARYQNINLGAADAAVVATAELLNAVEVATFDLRDFHVVRPLHVHSFELPLSAYV